MSFGVLGAEQFYAGVLDPDRFPNVEIVSFQPPGQDARAVYAHLKFDQQENQTERATRTERLLVRVGRDEAHAKGGIASFLRGDILRRENESESWPPFAATGEISEQTSWSWVLVFERSVPTGLGKRMPR